MNKPNELKRSLNMDETTEQTMTNSRFLTNGINNEEEKEELSTSFCGY